jgi:AraC-like DNA-binding protein
MRPRIRTDTLTGYAGLARSLRLDPADLMAEVGLHIADLDVPDRWLPAAPDARLLHLSAQQADCPDFGLRMAELRRLGSLGPLSVVLRDEPDLRSAVDLLTTYERAYNEALHLRLSEADGQATIEVWLECAEPAPRDQALDLVMAALLGIIRVLVGSDWRPASAVFSRPSPPDAGPWRRLFGPGVAFDRELTGLRFPARELATTVVTSDPSLRPYTQEFLHTVVAPRAPAVAGGLADVVEAVERLLPLRQHSMQQVSRELGLRPRGLQRYLADRGETFSSIVHGTRARLAERYLPNERYTLTEVSQLLGFEAPSAFSRWFRQQFGTSPKEWRRAPRAGSQAGGTSDVSGQASTQGGTVREG